MKDCFDLAKKIPSIGNGGTSIPHQLQNAGAGIKENEIIVETGSWFGSTTGFVMSGIKQTPFTPEYHCFDMWITYPHLVNQAKKIGITLKDGQSILDIFKTNIKSFEIDPIIHQGDFIQQKFKTDKKIGLVVDDICSKKPMFDHLLDLFIPFCYPGTLFFFMDFYFYTTHDVIRRKYQRDVMEKNQEAFEFIERPANSYTAIYRYKGGAVRKIRNPEYLKDWVDGEGNRVL
jgi:hypothetical protein